jgi:hypothetical protein
MNGKIDRLPLNVLFVLLDRSLKKAQPLAILIRYTACSSLHCTKEHAPGPPQGLVWHPLWCSPVELPGNAVNTAFATLVPCVLILPDFQAPLVCRPCRVLSHYVYSISSNVYVYRLCCCAPGHRRVYHPCRVHWLRPCCAPSHRRVYRPCRAHWLRPCCASSHSRVYRLPSLLATPLSWPQSPITAVSTALDAPLVTAVSIALAAPPCSASDPLLGTALSARLAGGFSHCPFHMLSHRLFRCTCCIRRTHPSPRPGGNKEMSSILADQWRPRI